MLRNVTEDRIPTEKQGSFIQKRCRGLALGFCKAAAQKLANWNVHGFMCYLIWQILHTSYGENLQYINILGTSLSSFFGDYHTSLSTIRREYAY